MGHVSRTDARISSKGRKTTSRRKDREKGVESNEPVRLGLVESELGKGLVGLSAVLELGEHELSDAGQEGTRSWERAREREYGRGSSATIFTIERQRRCKGEGRESRNGNERRRKTNCNHRKRPCLPSRSSTLGGSPPTPASAPSPPRPSCSSANSSSPRGQTHS
jgi:hypothetical protein